MGVLFRRNVSCTSRGRGCNLASTDRSAIREAHRKIEEGCAAFYAAINKHNSHLLFSDKELDGVDDLNSFVRDEVTGRMWVDLKAPDTQPAFNFATS